jgi:hypothetical protein
VILSVPGWPELAPSWRHHVGHLVDRGNRLSTLDVKPEQTKRIVASLRVARHDPDSVILMRASWDPMADSHDKVLSESDALREAEVTHVVPLPHQQLLSDYMRSIELRSEFLQGGGASFGLLAS